MNKTLIGCGAALVAVILIGLSIVWGSYNNLVSLDEGVNSAWSQVQNVYQRRADLVPNLVATVQGAADFEKGTLQAVVDARSRVGQVNFNGAPNAEQMKEFQANQDGLSSALSRLLVVVENYPQLKATEGFRDLQAQLEGTENRITVERQRFNEASQAYNTKRRGFPTVVFSGMLGFAERPYFEATAGADKPPQVQFK
jgi:LemA protein